MKWFTTDSFSVYHGKNVDGVIVSVDVTREPPEWLFINSYGNTVVKVKKVQKYSQRFFPTYAEARDNAIKKYGKSLAFHQKQVSHLLKKLDLLLKAKGTL